MTDVLKDLPRLSWRGIEVPVLEASWRFSHDNVQHKFIYRDGQLIEAIGAQNLTFSYTIPMRQDIAKGPYKNLFTDTLPRFFEACRDRTNGELVDPVLGLYQCKPTDASGRIDVQKRDGIDVQVEFVQSPDIEDLETIEVVGTITSATSDAGALDALAAKVDWKQEAPPEPTVDPLSAIDGLGQQVLFQANKVSAKLDDAAFRCEKLEKTVDKLENPQLWPLKRSSRRLRGAIVGIKERGQDPGKRVLLVLNRYERTISSVAAEFGITIQELLDLNPTLAGVPIVPSNTSIRRYG